MGECIKRALLKGPCPILLSGLKGEAEALLDKNEQLQRRAIPPIKLEPFQADSTADLNLFIEFLGEYLVRAEELGVAQNLTFLIEGDVPGCLLQVAGGVLGEAGPR